VRAVPHGFEGTYGLGCSSDALVNIIIVAQAKGNIGAEVFEVAAEGDRRGALLVLCVVSSSLLAAVVDVMVQSII